MKKIYRLVGGPLLVFVCILSSPFCFLTPMRIPVPKYYRKRDEKNPSGRWKEYWFWISFLRHFTLEMAINGGRKNSSIFPCLSMHRIIFQNMKATPKEKRGWKWRIGVVRNLIGIPLDFVFDVLLFPLDWIRYGKGRLSRKEVDWLWYREFGIREEEADSRFGFGKWRREGKDTFVSEAPGIKKIMTFSSKNKKETTKENKE